MDALKGTDFEGGKNWPDITLWMRAQEEVYNSISWPTTSSDQLNTNLA